MRSMGLHRAYRLRLRLRPVYFIWPWSKLLTPKVDQCCGSVSSCTLTSLPGCSASAREHVFVRARSPPWSTSLRLREYPRKSTSHSMRMPAHSHPANTRFAIHGQTWVVSEIMRLGDGLRGEVNATDGKMPWHDFLCTFSIPCSLWHLEVGTQTVLPSRSPRWADLFGPYFPDELICFWPY